MISHSLLKMFMNLNLIAFLTRLSLPGSQVTSTSWLSSMTEAAAVVGIRLRAGASASRFLGTRGRELLWWPHSLYTVRLLDSVSIVNTVKASRFSKKVNCINIIDRSVKDRIITVI